MTKKGELDEMVIVATAVILLIAGYETTGATLAFAGYQLAQNPEIQERLRKEVEEVCGGNNVCFIKNHTKHSYNSLLYLLRIFMKQTLASEDLCKN